MTYTLVTHELLGDYKLLILNNIKTTLLLSGSEIENKVYLLLNNTLYCIINLKLV